MKNLLILPMFLFSILLTNCGNETKSNSSTNSEDNTTVVEENLPDDEIRDTKKDDSGEEFNYSTISAVKFNLDIRNCDKKTIDAALVTLMNKDGNIICVSRSENGEASFNATISNVDKIAKIKIQHKSYEERIIEIDNIDQYLAVDRTLYMAEVIKDQEIEENLLTDEYTDDNHFIFAKKKFIVAYEDLYPNVGDADFNDTVALLDMTVYTEASMRYVNKVVIKTTILAAGSGFDQGLFINIYGSLMKESDYKLGIQITPEVHEELKDQNGVLHYNCIAPGENDYTSYYKPEPIITEIDFNPTVCTLHFPPMPFDPYIDAYVQEGEVHLPMVETPYTGKTVGTEEEGMVYLNGNEEITFVNFPWALVFPIDEFDGQESWRWPLETFGDSNLNAPGKANIFKAYPFFSNWYLSKGKESPGWYLLPDEEEKWIYTERNW